MTQALQARFQLMNVYIRQLVNGSVPIDWTHLTKIKDEFKTNGKLIARINAVFDYVMSGLVIAILRGVVRETLYFFYHIVSIVKHLMWKNDPELNYQNYTKEMVRCSSADVLVFLMKLSLIGFILLVMRGVNHESRSAPILLNDLFSRFAHSVNNNLYQSVSYGNIPSVLNIKFFR